MNASQFSLRNCKVGDSLPVLTGSPFTRADLALFAGASGDHNPLHIDSDYARQAGFNDVFVHGMFSFASLQKCLTRVVPQSAIEYIRVRFASIMQVGERPVCTAVVRHIEQTGNGCYYKIELTLGNEQGEIRLSAEAGVKL